jgi:glycosyltransferase involved in cell wall biosynthesis
MISSDVLVHTSYREATSNVIPEALSCGLPVICHDISGMAIAVTQECGIKVPLESHEKSVLGFRQALRELLPTSQNLNTTSPHLAALKSGSLHRATDLSWDHFANRLALDYARITNQS